LIVCISVVKPNVPTLVHIIPKGNSYVVGVTSMANQLFVMRQSAQQQIRVYDTTNFTLQRVISVPGLVKSFGLASCIINQCLYASDSKNNCVFRVEMSNTNAVNSWAVGHFPAGLSVNSASNVLVTCYKGHKIQEYTTRGLLVREINLQHSVITSPWHSIHLSNDEFVVSHSHRICIVNASGAIIRSYGSTTAGSADGQLNYPVGLIQVRNGCFLVADRCNNRLVILDSSLVNARVLPLPVDCGLKYPFALHFDKSRGRLYVGEYDTSRVFTFDSDCNV
jgi:DNA-binding beta-propeller fold protein YncE